jgi:plastocyanin
MRKLLVLVLALAFALVACGDDDDDGGGSDSGGDTPEGDVTLVAEDFQFEPADLQAGPGAITIVLQNGGNADHNLTIESLDVDQDVAPGEATTVDVDVPEGENVEFFCKFHEAQGMVGTLTAGGGAAPGGAPSSEAPASSEPPAMDEGGGVPGY